MSHLGGYCPGGDAATYYPELWTWLAVALDVRTVLDVGCGEGYSVDYFVGLGCDVLGIEGTEQDHPDIVHHDYTTGPYIVPAPFDLCWSSEFVEHVEEEFVPNFLVTFAMADLVLMTHADPGQLGYHHVNCQTSAYWIERLASIDYELDESLTAKTRALAAENLDPLNHYVRSGLAFRRLSP